MRAYRGLTAAMAVLFAGLGIALIVETIRVGGGVGYLFGALFVAAGAARLYLLRSRRR
jgi:hypothetical protein